MDPANTAPPTHSSAIENAVFIATIAGVAGVVLAPVVLLLLIAWSLSG